MNDDDLMSPGERWARLRFAVVGPLLAAPPGRGELRGAIESLALRSWRHPTTGELTRFAFSTIERWYYQAYNAERDPVGALRRRVRADTGEYPSLSPEMRLAIEQQYGRHRGWSVKLHFDNLAVLARQSEHLGVLPSYATLRRYMRAHSMKRTRPPSRLRTEGERRAARRLERLEVRSYEAELVSALWHLDFHEGSRRVLLSDGRWVKPHLLGVLDDHSRLACHVQWYLTESTATLTHGLTQAFLKRGLPRSILMDNGSAMTSAETRRGLLSVGVMQAFTLTASPYQNGKQESFWNRIEDRLLPMLEGVVDLTLAYLNEATQAFVELDYHRAVHSEIHTTPLIRFRDGPQAGRESPDALTLRQGFRRDVWRRQRISDGTITLEGRRFEVPSRFGHIKRLRVRYARFDFSHVDLVDPKTGRVLSALYPLDKAKNADGIRRRREASQESKLLPPLPAKGPAPLLDELMEKMREAGVPPAYMPLPDSAEDSADNDEARANDDAADDTNNDDDSEEEV